jgi:mannonate dehydratase
MKQKTELYQVVKGLEQTWRWFGPDDPIPLSHIRMAGATGIVTALHHIPNGQLWTLEEIEKRKIIIESKGLTWSVVESLPVHEDIKKRSGRYQEYISTYQQSIRNLGKAGIDTVCYNFMPVLDWSRTDLQFSMADGSTALRFDKIHLAVFDMFLLDRKDATSDYSPAVREKASTVFNSMTADSKKELISNILAGLPGAEEHYTLEKFKASLQDYDSIDSEGLRNNLVSFLEEIIPIAEESDVLLAIHPDDPPFPIMGLPRIMSTERNVNQIFKAVDSPNNGLCFCSGSFGARSDNDLEGIIKRLGHRINFVHLRNVIREDDESFYEADHLLGDVDMYGIMKALLLEKSKRILAGRTDTRMPMRPDHGHQMLDDLSKEVLPGYSAIGRLRGLAELRGLQQGIQKSLF